MYLLTFISYTQKINKIFQFLSDFRAILLSVFLFCYGHFKYVDNKRKRIENLYNDYHTKWRS